MLNEYLFEGLFSCIQSRTTTQNAQGPRSQHLDETFCGRAVGRFLYALANDGSDRYRCDMQRLVEDHTK